MGELDGSSWSFCQNLFETVDDIRELALYTRSGDEIRTLMMLTLNQERMVRTIVRMTRDNPEGIALKDLADRLSLSSSAVSVMVENLVHKGVLERLTSPRDRRMVLIRLGEPGRAFMCEWKNYLSEIAGQFLEKESEANRRNFFEMLDRFHDYIKTMKGFSK